MISEILGPRARDDDNLYALVVFLKDRELLVSDADPRELARALRALADTLDRGGGGEVAPVHHRGAGPDALGPVDMPA